MIEAEFSQYDKRYGSSMPKITIFENIDWLKNIYNDIISYLDKNWYFSIKMFASNLLDSYWDSNENVKNYRKEFLSNLKEKKISIDTFLWNWISLMESLWKLKDIDSLYGLPAANSSINIIIAGTIVYIIIFRDIPTWLKIDNEELAFSMHFIFEHLK